ncbi:helix-turn-helix domain-containing protein [Pseudonocardia nigra]|uniref:helix-turn-helix domain-containing protein n=1 Tax=Pseudonocardia nigra TaxID=1921578 RepID=UPI001C5E3C9D|nr:helix-turn-helix domain-containing protein [Pseudonocardia nigra]
MKWNLRLAAANRGIWKASELRRMLAERGVEMSTGKMSGLWSGQPNVLRPEELDAFCAVLGCEISDLITAEPEKTPAPGPGTEETSAAVGQHGGGAGAVRAVTPEAEVWPLAATAVTSGVSARAGAAPCRTCAGPVDRSAGPRGAWPRLHCHRCRPPRARNADPERGDNAPCRTCEGSVDRSPGRRRGRRRLHCHTCRPPVARRHVAKHRLDDLARDSTVSSTQRAVLARAFESAETVGWSTRSLDGVVAGLRGVLDDLPDGQPVRLSQLHAATGVSRGPRVARMAQILDELGLLVDDTVPTVQAWIDHKSDALPVGFRAEVRAWLLTLLEGEMRARPRAQSTLYAYFGRVQPHLFAWSATRGQLREITEDDVRGVLDQLSGHLRAGTFTALRSLFRFAKRRRLIFADPTRRLHVGRAPARALLPMTEAQIAAVQRVAVTPAQRLVVALAAVHAARAKTIPRAHPRRR